MSKTPKKIERKKPPKENKRLTNPVIGVPVDSSKLVLVNKPTKM